MGQPARTLTQIAGFRGWKVAEAYWEDRRGQRVEPVAGYDVAPDTILVLRLARRWAPRCAKCLAIGEPGCCHERCTVRRWADLPWAGHRVVLEYAPIRVKCHRCKSHAVNLLAWAEPKQRQTRRRLQHLALDAFRADVEHLPPRRRTAAPSR